MPLTKKGKKIMKSMKDQYGEKEGKAVFYASANKGKIKKVHGKKNGGEAKIKKVIGGLKKASKLHAAQAKSLKTVIGKKAGGTMEPYYGSFISGTVDGKKLSNPSYKKYYGNLLRGFK